jgi:hypothetical protein
MTQHMQPTMPSTANPMLGQPLNQWRAWKGAQLSKHTASAHSHALFAKRSRALFSLMLVWLKPKRRRQAMSNAHQPLQAQPYIILRHHKPLVHSH